MKPVLFSFLLLSLFSCAQPELKPALSPPPSPFSSHDAAFDALVDRTFDRLFELDPIFATSAGFHWYDEKMPDLSQQGIARRDAVLRELLAEWKKVDLVLISPARQIDARLLTRYLESQLFALNEVRTWKTNPMVYQETATWGVYQLLSRDFAPLDARFRAITARLLAVPGIFTAARENLENPPRIFCEKTLELMEGTMTLLKETLPQAARDLKDPEIARRFQEANDKAIAAAESFSAWIKEDLLPRAQGDFAYGPTLFARKLALDEWVDLTPEQLLALGEEALRKTQERFAQIARESFGGKTPLEVAKELHKDHPDRETLLPEVRAMLTKIRAFVVENKIVTLPNDQGLKVAEQPGFLWGFASMDAPGAYEKSQEAFYYIPLPSPELGGEDLERFLQSYNRAGLQVISLHEAYPGHYVQLLFQRDRVNSKTRKLLWSYHFGEGWAHYTEQMMIEEGYGKGDPRIELAMLSESLLRICRLIAAIKLHTQGATVEEMTRLFREEGYQDERTSREEAIRGTFDPMYLSYAMGKILIYQLREEVRAQEGDAFSLQHFHDRLLSNGSIPVALHREILLKKPSETASAKP